MGIKWKSTFYDYGNPDVFPNLWTVEILDMDSVLNPEVDFYVKKEGLKISGQSRSRDVLTPLVTTKCSCTMLIDRIGVEDFITELIDSKEERFWLRVRRSSVVAFLGVIITDGIILEDLAYPYEFTFTAVDMLSRLQSVELDANLIPASNRSVYSINEFYDAIFDRTLVDEFYTPGSVLHEMYVHWRSDTHPNTTDFTWEMTGFDYKAFNKIDGNNVKFTKIVDMLSQFLGLFNARMIWNFGYYITEQRDYRAQNTSLERYRFDKDMVFVSNDTGLGYLNKVYDGSTIRRLRGMTTTVLPPAKSVLVKYKHDPIAGAIIDQQPPYVGGSTVEGDEIIVLNNDDRLLMKLNIAFENGTFYESDRTAATRYLRPKVLIEVKVGTGGDARWLKQVRTGGTFANIEYSGMTWESTQSYIEAYPMLVNKAGYAIYRDDLTSPPLSQEFALFSSHEIEITVSNTEYLDQNNVLKTKPAGHYEFSTETSQSTGTHFQVYMHDGNDAAQEVTETIFIADGDPENSKVLEYTTEIGEGPSNHSQTGIKVQDGVNWRSNTEDWGANDDNICDLLAESILAARRKPTRQINASLIYHQWQPAMVIELDGIKYMCESYTYTAHNQTIKGRWTALDHDTAGVTKRKEQYVTILDPVKPGGVDPEQPYVDIQIPFELDQDRHKKYTGVNASFVSLPSDWVLPDPADVTPAEIDRRIVVVVNGVKAAYDEPYGFDYDHTTNELSFLNRSGTGTRSLSNGIVDVTLRPA